MFRSSIEISREICQVEDSGELIVKKRVRNASTSVDHQEPNLIRAKGGRKVDS
jgi:hypothetical protein